MTESYKLFLPKSKREVKIDISISKNREGITFDTLYLLDGQNSFSDSKAAFGRSIRATKTLSFTAKRLKKRILGVAIYNSGTDKGRIEEYTPFYITNPESKNFQTSDIKKCEDFCDDFINTIIPFIDSKYNTYKDKNHRFIYGSSLAAITALYIAFKYPESFNYVGAFSTASFLFENDFLNFLKENKNMEKNIFLYVGDKETSDSMYKNDEYLNASYNLYQLFKEAGNRIRLSIDPNGLHNEETWGKHLYEFINFIYFDDIFINYS